MKMRKFLAMLLTLSLVLSLAAPMALAAEEEDGGTKTDVVDSGDSGSSESGDTTTDSGSNDSTGSGDSSEDGETENPGGEDDKNDNGQGGETGGNTGGGSINKPDGTTGTGEEKPPVVDPETPGEGEENPGDSEENPPVDTEKPGDGEVDPENPGDGEEKPPVVDPETPGEGEENPGDGEEDPDKGHEVPPDDEINRPNPEEPEIPVDPENPEIPPLSEEDQAVLDQLGSAVAGITGETSREELEAIQNSPLFDRLTDEQKQAVLDALKALEEPVVPVIPPVVEDGSLYAQLMNAQTHDEYIEIWNNSTLEERQALTDEEMAAVARHMDELLGIEEPEEEGTEEFIAPVSFTGVAPLKPEGRRNSAAASSTASKGSRRARSMARSADYDEATAETNPVTLRDENGNISEEDGIVTRKSIVEHGDGKATLTVEAYSTGEFTEARGADIVLVLDQSGSMNYCINCDGHHGSGSDWYLSKNDHTAPQYRYTNECRDYDWTIFGVVFYCNHTEHYSSYGRYYTTRTLTKEGCPYYEDSSADDYAHSRQAALVEAVNSFLGSVSDSSRVAIIRYSSGTYTSNSAITGWNTLAAVNGRTISVPGTLLKNPKGSTDTAGGLKNAATILTNQSNANREKVVILFTDGEANSSEDALKNANALKASGVTVYTVGVFGGAEVSKSPNVNKANGSTEQRCNYLMQAMSSNCGQVKYGSSISPDYEEPNAENNYKGSSHYLIAADSDELSGVFEDLAEETNSNVSYDGTTIIRDTITPYFNVKSVTAKAVASNGTINSEGTPLTIEPGYQETGIVSVTGFDFSDSDNAVIAGKQVGKKVVITIEVERKPDFWGGNGVPTNVTNQSGVYVPKEGGGEECVQSLKTNPQTGGIASPKLNVSLLPVQLIPQDRNIYYGNAAPTVDNLHQGDNIRVQYAGQSSYTEVDYNSLTWQIDYAELGNAVLDPDRTVSNTEDGAYTVSRAVVPTKSGFIGDGTASFAANETAKVNVFTPTILLPDVRTYLTAPVMVDEKDFPISETQVTWKHNNAGLPAGETMEGKAPSLTVDIKGRVTALHDGNDGVRDYYAFVETVHFGTGAQYDVTYRDKEGVKDTNQTVVTVEREPCTDGLTTSHKFDSNSGDFLVHVFKPEVTFTDKVVYKGEEMTSSFSNEFTYTWKYPGTNIILPNSGAYAYASGKTVQAPAVTCDSYEVRDLFKAGEKSYFEVDTPVHVQMKVGDGTQYTPAGVKVSHNINECVTFVWKHDKCLLGDPQHQPYDGDVKGHQFWVHVETCDLTVEKTIGGDGKPYSASDSFLFKIKGAGNPLAKTVDMEIFITGAGKKTIKGLPVGTYTVTEDTGWSWRYELTTLNNVQSGLTKDNPSGSASFTNKLVNENWLSSEAVAVNTFNTRNAGVTYPTLDTAALPEERETGHNDEIPDAGPETTD